MRPRGHEFLRVPVSSASGLTRRRLIGRLAMAGVSAPAITTILRESGFAQEATPAAGTPTPQEVLQSLGKSPDLIPHGTTNFETPLELLDTFLTPNERFFIRSNGPVAIDVPADEWRLTVSGLVDQELDLSLADLQGMPTQTVTAFLECSGNARGRFDSPAEGSQWGNGAIGNAEWTGVSVIDVLDMAGVREGAVDLVSQDGDFSEMQRGLEVIDHPFDGHYNTESYVIINEDGTILRPVREMPVYSVIATPGPDAEIAAGEQTIGGFAWSGWAGIARVEVSIDSGEWQEATIAKEAGPTSWVRFKFPWTAEAGAHTLRSRATDQIAHTQPEETVWNAKGYQMNAIFEAPVTAA